MTRAATGCLLILLVLVGGGVPSAAAETVTTHEIIIAPRFDWADAFSEGLAAVQLDGRLGYINAGGRMVLESTEDITLLGAPFSFGRVPVQTGERTPEGGRPIAYIDQKGNVVVRPAFSYAGPFVSGTAVVKFQRSEYFSVIDPSGNELAALKPPRKLEPGFRFETSEPSFAQGPALFVAGQKKGYMAADGNIVVRPIFDEADVFSEGLAAVRISSSGPVGYINAGGETIIAPRFKSAERFINGFAVVQAREDGHRWGIIDARGGFAVPAGYYGLQYLGEGVYLGTRRQGEQELVFTDGRPPVDLADDVRHVREFHNGLAAVALPPSAKLQAHSADIPNSCGYIDTAGRSVFPEPFRSCSDFKDGLAWVQDTPETEQYFIDKTGRRVNPEIRGYGKEAEGLVPVLARNGKWGYARRLR